PLAEVAASASSITTVTDLRSQAFLQVPSLTGLGLTATAEELNRALAGVTTDVTAANLGSLTAGPDSSADTLHRHVRSYQAVAGTAGFSLINDHSDPAANIALQFSLPQRLPDDTLLLVDPATGFLQQRYLG